MRLNDTKLMRFAHSAADRAARAQTARPYSRRNATRLIRDEIRRRLATWGPDRQTTRGHMERALEAACEAFAVYDVACDAHPF